MTLKSQDDMTLTMIPQGHMLHLVLKSHGQILSIFSMS